MLTYVEMVEAEKRSRTSLVTKKEQVSVELIKDIVRKYGYEDATLKDLRLATMRVLSFARLFRAKELLNLTLSEYGISRGLTIISSLM